jgi:hypothetical protein
MATIEPYTTKTGLKRYRVRYRTPEHKQTDKRGFTTKCDAELFRASVAVSIARGEYVPARAGRVTVGELAGRWLAHRVTQKPSTTAATEGALRTHVLPKWRDVYAADISHTDVKSWVARLSAERGPSTVHRAHNVLSMILEDARDGRLARNPAAVVPLPRTRHTAASLAVSAGANVKAVQRMLGHASAAMTLDTYADLFDDDLDSVADALDAAASEQDVGRMWARTTRP